MRRRIKAWISRYLVDTSIEVQKLREMTQEMKDLNDNRERRIADLNDTNKYWIRDGESKRKET